MTMPSSQLHHHDLREVDGEASSIFRTVSELASTQCILNRRYCFLQRGAGRMQHLRALAALERLIFYELMNNLLIALEQHSNRDACYFKYCILDHLLNRLVLLLQLVVCLGRRVISTESRTIGEASGSCSRPKNRHLLLGPRQARTIKGLTPPTSLA